MRYTDKFFKFPIRLYDGIELRKLIDEEEKLFEVNPDAVEAKESAWVEGKAAILADDIISYHETFSRSMDTESVMKEGGDLTLITMRNLEEHLCMWDIKKFEEKLNSFMEKRQAAINSITEEKK